ncbi:MAG: hypothetical protein FJW30_18905 [Acidobacteria bacterium]|nr:hypothetical protein [Acidobacteriota bacterium]
MPVSRRSALSILGGAPLWALPELRHDDGVLRVSAPGNLHFIEGPVLKRLQDGAGLVFSLQLTLSTDQFRTVSRRQVERFVVSFDLWEEKFAVTRLGLVKQQTSHLSRDAAERWMFDHAGLSLHGLRGDSPNWVRTELRVDDPRDSGGFILDPSLTLARLVDWFGRAPRGEASRWAWERGPFRLNELER